MTQGKKEPALKRLLDKTTFNTRTGCWEWTASRTPGGYGAFNAPGVARNAHRALYVLMVGPIPKDRHLDHICRNRRCVNPDHLEPVTQAENNRRAAAVKTHCPKGHPYVAGNLVRRSNRPASRDCATCNRERAAAHYRRKTGAAA